MIDADLHTHTNASHGVDDIWRMYEAASARGLRYMGFSEHSPLPDGFFCHLYTGNLEETFPRYADNVLSLKQEAVSCRPLLGMELDWLPTRLEWMRSLASRWPFDYVLGSIHYLDGYSVGNIKNWTDDVGRGERFGRFSAYFYEMASMVSSGLINIVSHPDFIKLRAWRDFYAWLDFPESGAAITCALKAMRDHGVAMELSSAGLRQEFREPYPCPHIMELARNMGVDIAIGSDAHNSGDVAGDFDVLRQYAASFGFDSSLIYIQRQPVRLEWGPGAWTPQAV